MSLPRILKIITISLIVAEIQNGNGASVTDNDKENSEDSSFVIHLSNTDMLKDEIGSDIRLNLKSLEEEIHKQKNKLDHIQQILSKLDQKLEANLEKLESENGELKHLLGQHCVNGQQLENSIASQCKQKKQWPNNCEEAFLFVGDDTSGIYKLHLSGLKPFNVYCLKDPDNGPAWAIIQRREDNSTDFYRNWDDYKHGFGDLQSNFFIGLDIIHAMTHSQPNELWIQLEDFEGQNRYAKYDNFSIGTEDQKYALNVLGKFSGDAGDSLRRQKGMKFTTKDNDNDEKDNANCAEWFHGAWWYQNCHDSNLNGRYFIGEMNDTVWGEGIEWNHWHGAQYSLRKVQMAIRPKI